MPKPKTKKRFVDQALVDPFTVQFCALSVILLAFFILLNSMANLDQQKVLKALGSLMGTFGRMPGGEDANVDPGMLSNPELEVSQSELDELANHLSKILDRENLGGEVDVFLREDDVVIRLEGKTLFAEGSDELLPAGAALISEVYQIVAQSSRALSIEGHTDDGSTAMSAHGTHWMFAAARAARVHDAFLDMGLDPTRLTVASLGRTRPRMPNETAYQRSLNRRVEIVVEEGAHDPAFRPRTRIVDFNGIPVEVPIDDSDAEPAAQSRGA